HFSNTDAESFRILRLQPIPKIMRFRLRLPILCSTMLLCVVSSAWTQEPLPAGKPDSGSLNATIVAARQATAEKRFADAGARTSKVTTENPKLVLPWVELGLAQLGSKKYPEAENSFKMALGID